MKILKFYAEWCAPCTALSESLKQNPINIPIESINIDEDFETTKKYGVRSVPYVVILNDTGDVLKKGVANKASDIVKMLASEN